MNQEELSSTWVDAFRGDPGAMQRAVKHSEEEFNRELASAIISMADGNYLQVDPQVSNTTNIKLHIALCLARYGLAEEICLFKPNTADPYGVPLISRNLALTNLGRSVAFELKNGKPQ